MKLSDDRLLSSYLEALEYKLEEAFIELLEKELIKRGIVFMRPSKEDNEEN
ncbi:sporulation histidine kinase inhibitor Sda [Paenibacillus ferrarius]|uniref:sporulation histidine kinase inhibitor Sda n=1 Tax=Paenibacillus ferrarius TaxID=1469647 RepID=UPI00117D9416|nr:sporulation histidine kinase inhibitor Sda [Paenibacillus ferrarius]